MDAPRQNLYVLELGYHAGGCLGAVDDNVYMDETMTWMWFLSMAMDAGPRLGAVDAGPRLGDAGPSAFPCFGGYKG